jgi:hypothetical protein
LLFQSTTQCTPSWSPPDGGRLRSAEATQNFKL